jgi:hypothetical protein
MGAWGSSVFENDAAEDWIGELLEEGRDELIGEALGAVTEGATEADECSAALAAAEVIAAARGWPVRAFPQELKQWIEEFDYRPADEANSLAIEAVQRVRDDSELAELWKENRKEEKKWRVGLDDLIERLQKAAKQRPATKKPKQPAPAGVKQAIKRLRDLDTYIQTTLTGQAKYVHVQARIDDATLAGCLPFVSKTKVLKIGWGGMTATPETPKASDAALVSLDQFTALQDLHLNNTQITDATLARLRNLTKLRELGLTGTNISDAGLEHLRGLSALESLELGSTSITDEGLVILSGLRNLKKLDLFKTVVTDEGLQYLAGLTNLADLDLRYTKITGRGLEHLAKMTNMWLLELDHTLIDDEGITQLSKMTKLARLTVRGKRITDQSMSTIGQLKSLRGLVLENTKITDAALATLAGLPALEIVHLAGTEITIAGARWLRGACPKLTVIGKDK